MPPKKNTDEEGERWGPEQWAMLVEDCARILEQNSAAIAKNPAYAPWYNTSNCGLAIKRRVVKLAQEMREKHAVPTSTSAPSTPVKRKSSEQAKFTPESPTKKAKTKGGNHNGTG